MTDVKDRVKDAIDEGAAKAKNATDAVAEKASETVQTVGEKVQDAGKKIEDSGK